MKPSIDIPYFRQLLHQNKGFLYDLYRGQSLPNKKLVATADDSQLNVLIKLINLIYHHVIPLKQEHGNKIRQAKRVPYLTRIFKQNASYAKLLLSPRSIKIRELQGLASVFPMLLSPLFEEM